MAAYYSEFDPKAAAWLRELIKRGLIADGEVDERDLWDVTPDDIRAFTQVHFCAGIGVWSYALRNAGWPDDRPVWTASFPCQPFSAAGKGKGFADERHLWPAGHFLIEECRPPVVFGEQVASKDGLDWLDLVQADLEGSGYACGAVDLCAAGLGAPHIRQRLYWTAERLADADDARPQGRGQPGRERSGERPSGQSGVAGGLEHAASDGRIERRAEPSGRGAAGGRGNGGLADSDGRNPGAERQQRGGEQRQQPQDGGATERVADASDQRHERSGAARGRGNGPADDSALDRPSPTNGLWRDADWLFCRDGKFRPVEPGTFPLVDGAPARVGRLRGYGNAIVAPVAQAFIEACLDALTALRQRASYAIWQRFNSLGRPAPSHNRRR